MSEATATEVPPTGAIAVTAPVQAGQEAVDEFAALDGVDFLDDVDFTLEDVESRIAPLALAHT